MSLLYYVQKMMRINRKLQKSMNYEKILRFFISFICNYDGNPNPNPNHNPNPNPNSNPNPNPNPKKVKKTRKK